MKALENVIKSFRSLRAGLDEIVIGYSELKDALVCALFRRALGLKGHLLVFSAPGLGKTTLMKGAAELVARMNGGHVVFDRTQGRSDLTPEEFLSRRVAEYNGDGRLHFMNMLQTVRSFVADSVTGMPGLWLFDELDASPHRALSSLTQVMEEQTISAEGIGTKALNFTMLATANTKKYTPEAQPIPRRIQDRFPVTVEVGFLPLDQDVEILKSIGGGKKRMLPSVVQCDPSDLLAVRNFVAENGLGGLLNIDEQIVRGCATVTKLTQTKLPDFTDFSGKFKVSAGPRSYIDLLQEAAVASLLSGSEVIASDTCINVGCRVYRGRVEVTPDVTMNGDTADTIITKILHEVFGAMKVDGGGSGSGDPR